MSLFAQVSIPWDHCNVCGLQQREEHSFHLGCVWIAVVKLWVIIVHLLWDMIKIFLYPFFTHIDILCSLSFQVCLLMFAHTFQQGCTPNKSCQSENSMYTLCHFYNCTLWEQIYQKHWTNWYFVNFTKYLVNVLKFIKYLVNVHKIR